jgi:hypothetical protein
MRRAAGEPPPFRAAGGAHLEQVYRNKFVIK